MSAVAIEPAPAHYPPCSWCGLRLGPHIVHASPTCTECRDGGRRFRVRMSIDKLRRAAGRDA